MNTAAKKAVLIPHGEAGPADKDRASVYLSELGYELDWRKPEAGDSLLTDLAGPADRGMKMTA